MAPIHSSQSIHPSLPRRPSHTWQSTHLTLYSLRHQSSLITYRGSKASLLTSMGSMNRQASLARIIRFDITISMARLTGRTRLERLCRQTMLTRLTSFPRLASMKGMTRQTRQTRMIRLARLHRLIRGYG